MIELLVFVITIVAFAMIFGPSILCLLLLAAVFTYDSSGTHLVEIERPSN